MYIPVNTSADLLQMNKIFPTLLAHHATLPSKVGLHFAYLLFFLVVTTLQSLSQQLKSVSRSSSSAQHSKPRLLPRGRNDRALDEAIKTTTTHDHSSTNKTASFECHRWSSSPESSTCQKRIVQQHSTYFHLGRGRTGTAEYLRDFGTVPFCG